MLEKMKNIPKCKKCGNSGVLDMKYDAYYCKLCLEWLESKCSDPSCSYCASRPDFPELIKHS